MGKLEKIDENLARMHEYIDVSSLVNLINLLVGVIC